MVVVVRWFDCEGGFCVFVFLCFCEYRMGVDAEFLFANKVVVWIVVLELPWTYWRILARDLNLNDICQDCKIGIDHKDLVSFGGTGMDEEN